MVSNRARDAHVGAKRLSIDEHELERSYPNRVEPKRRVLIIDGHCLFCELFGRVLAATEDLLLVGMATTARQALGEARRTRPDIIVLGLALPDGDGLDLVTDLECALPNVSIVLSISSDVLLFRERQYKSVVGEVSKRAPTEEILAVLRRARRGEPRARPRSCEDAAEPRALVSLTRREHQVLRLIASGLRTAAIARRLGLSPKTVETHRVRLYAKLGCATSIELALVAIRMRAVEI